MSSNPLTVKTLTSTVYIAIPIQMRNGQLTLIRRGDMPNRKGPIGVGYTMEDALRLLYGKQPRHGLLSGMWARRIVDVQPDWRLTQLVTTKPLDMVVTTMAKTGLTVVLRDTYRSELTEQR